DEIGLSTRQIGLIYTVNGLGYVAASALAGGRLAALPARRTCIVAAILGGLCTGVVLSAREIWVVVPMLALAAFLGAFGSIFVIGILDKISPVGTGTTMVLNGSVFNFGSAIGAAVGGLLIAWGGYSALAIGLPLFAFVAAGLAA